MSPAGTLPDFEQPDEAVIYHFALELLDEYGVSGGRFKAAVKLLGEAGVAQVFTLGYYTLISMSLNVFRV